ncbi:MAG: D-alanyl-D-alanine carboxypeptidase [Rhodobiaceae bacterium]|nr:D-alanyl-D-alanine carboxypeptidase [Rhodobiaceae bacterium]
MLNIWPCSGGLKNAAIARTLARLSLAAVLAVFCLAAAGTELRAQTIDTSAPYVIVIDYDSNTVLLEKDADKPVPPASLSKLMTMEVVFHAIKEKRLTLDDTFHISENAWRKGGATSGGSTMFAQLNSDIKLSDLIQGVIVQSGNDACIAIAEGMAGSEEAFASMLNERARELGLTNSSFANATGLPDPNHYMSMRDLAKLARHMIREYPDLYRYYSQPEFTWNNILQRNRNPLLREAPGADGMKTGYIKDSGYGLVGTTLRDGQRVILAMTGLGSVRERASEARKMIDWAYRSFEQLQLFDADETVGEARVYGGEKRWVRLVGDGAIKILLPRGQRQKMKARIVYRGPLLAPIEEGARVAEMRVTTDVGVTLSVPLYAGEEVSTGKIHQRALDAVLDLITRWW